MKKMSQEAQMQANGGKTLTITCNGNFKNGKNGKATGCGYKTEASTPGTWLAEYFMGIHLENRGHYLCTYTWTK